MFVRGSGIIVSAPTFRRRSPPRRVPAYMRRSGRVPSVCVSDSSSSVAILRSERDRLAGPGELSGSLFLPKDSVRNERASPAMRYGADMQRRTRRRPQGGGPHEEPIEFYSQIRRTDGAGSRRVDDDSNTWGADAYGVGGGWIG